MKKPKLIILDF